MGTGGEQSISPLVVALIGLGGAVIGAGASFLATLFTQLSIARREQGLHDREQGRVKALFAAQAQRLASLVVYQSKADAILLPPASLIDAVLPLEKLSRETSLVLALDEPSIAALFEAVRTVREETGTFEAVLTPEFQTLGDERRRTAVVRGIFRESAKLSLVLLRALGVDSPVEAPQLVIEIDDQESEE